MLTASQVTFLLFNLEVRYKSYIFESFLGGFVSGQGLILALSIYFIYSCMKKLLTTLVLSSFFLFANSPLLTANKLSLPFSRIKEMNMFFIVADMFNKVSQIESSSNPKAHNLKEDAVGIIQIRPIMVREVNRLVGFEKYKLEDRWDVNKSFDMFYDFQIRRNKGFSLEKGCRMWNGGINGHKKASTNKYWDKIKRLV